MIDVKKLRDSIEIDGDAYNPIWVDDNHVSVQITNCGYLDQLADEEMHKHNLGGMEDEDCDNLWYNLWIEYKWGSEKHLQFNGIMFETENHPHGQFEYTISGLDEHARIINDVVDECMMEMYMVSLEDYAGAQLKED